MRFTRLQHAVLGLSLLAIAGLMANTMAPVARAQSATTGAVSGTVSDATGAVVPGATVIVTDTATQSKQTVKTNGEGRYTVGLLKPGLYKITAAAESLKSDTLQVTVILGTSVPADIKVTPTGNNTVIEVTSTALPLVDTQNVALATTFNEQQIDELPTPGGDVTTVAFTAPGVVVNAGGAYGNFSSDGLPGISNLFVLNGFDNQDPFLNLNNSGSSNLTLGQGELAEATVIQNGYNSQYGRAAGAVINYTTKSGTNKFHGMADYNWNGSVLNANGWYNENNEVASGLANTRPHAVSNEWAANVGGPIIKDKLFFFSDYEGLHYVLPGSSGYLTFPSTQLQNYTMATIPAASQSFYALAFAGYQKSPAYAVATPVTNGNANNQDGSLGNGQGVLGCGNMAGVKDTLTGGTFGVNEACMLVGTAAANNINVEWLYTQRVDWNINDKHKIYGRYKMDRGTQPTSTSFIDPLFSALSIQPEYEGQFNDSYVIDSTKTNVFVAAANWYTAYFGPPNVSASLAALPANFYPDVDYDLSGVNGAGGLPSEGVPYYLTQGRNVTQYQFEDDFSWIKGKHTMKLGFNFRRDDVSDYDSQIANVFPIAQLATLADFVSGQASTNSNYFGANVYEKAYIASPTAHLSLYNIGIYGQDEYQVTPKLKLTLGARFDRTGNPLCHRGCFGLYEGAFPNNPGLSSPFDVGAGGPVNAAVDNAFPSIEHLNFQPRFGFNLALSDHTELRGGAGLFADLYPAGFLDGVIQNFPNSNVVPVFAGDFNVSGPGTVGAFADVANAVTQNGFKSGANATTIENTLYNQLVPYSPPSINAYFPGTFKTPIYAEYSMQLQHQLSKSDAIIVTYAGNYGYHGVLQNPWLNAGDGQFGDGFWNGLALGSWSTPASGATFGNFSATPADPRFGRVTSYTNDGHSNYNGALITFKHSGQGLTTEFSYTYSHSLDMVSNGGEGEYFNGGAITQQLTPALGHGNLNYSNSDYDVRNNLTGDLVYEEPFKSGNKLVNYLGGGWLVGAKVYYRTGEPYSITNGAQLAPFGNLGTTLLGALASGVNVSQLKNLSTSNAHLGAYGYESTLDVNQFVGAGDQNYFGTLRRNTLYGPHYADTDMNLMKKFVKLESFTFKAGINAYNLFNDVNFGAPAGNVQNPGSFGKIYGALAPPTSPYGSFQGAAVTQRLFVLHGTLTF
jgi:outer membrane receptor protein involved in Fe transport